MPISSVITYTVGSEPPAPAADPISPLDLLADCQDCWFTGGPNFEAQSHTPDAAVASWANEKAGRPALAQATGASQWIYRASVADFDGNPGLEADGVNDFMSAASPGSLAHPFTVVMLVTVPDIDEGVLFAGGTTSGVRGIGHYEEQWTLAFGTFLVGVLATTGRHLLIGHGNGAASYLKSSATDLVRGDSGSTALASRLVGGQSTVLRPKACTVRLIQTFSGELSADNQAGLVAWAATEAP